ncbi:putative acyl--CoA ligase YdaB [Episyrphus balteatus]|uniref:putative acyl--CoA ligase YdaB n=1 Tax=Episyrphus balteatus TaxID=286459 RepID=UPI002486CB77|nr:putative acyl--CoA ligase YdaB [Episyrphus balteatus]
MGMSTAYNETEKTWRAPSNKNNYPKAVGLGQLILQKLKETDPEKVLEVENESGNSLTAGQIRSKTITVAQNLIRLGIKKDDIVIVFSKSSIKISPITFALYTIGATVNFFYLELKGEDIEYFFELFNPTAILYEEQFKNSVFQALKNVKLSNLKHIISLDSQTESVDEVLFKPTKEDIENFQPPDIGHPDKAVAVLAFTTGSTGKPKISTFSHSMLLLGIHNKWWQKMDSESVVCVLSDLRWTCQIQIMIQPIFFGCKRVYTSKCEKDYDESSEYELLHKNKVTHFLTIPILLMQTLKNAENANQTSKLSHLRIILTGGEVVSDPLIKYAGEILPNCQIVNGYGMTELPGVLATDELVLDRYVNGGTLMSGYQLKVIDENGNHLGPNEKGRLCFKPIVPLIGYFKNEEANKEHFKGDDGWFTTADYGFMDSDNLLHVVIRYDYLLRFNGQFIVPTKLEDVINYHPNVFAAALVGHPDPENKDSDIGTMFVALNDYSHRDVMENEILALLRANFTKEEAKLVQYLKILDEIPIVNNCKVNRTLLKKMASNECEKSLKI